MGVRVLSRRPKGVINVAPTTPLRRGDIYDVQLMLFWATLVQITLRAASLPAAGATPFTEPSDSTQPNRYTLVCHCSKTRAGESMRSDRVVKRPLTPEARSRSADALQISDWRKHWELLLFFCIAAIGALSAILGAPIPIRTVFGLPLVLFIPGYALVSALFPSNEGLDGIERIALGFGLSLALIPLIALGIEYSPWKLELIPIVTGLMACTVLFSAVAVLRRAHVSEEEKFVAAIPKPDIPPPSSWSGTTKVAMIIMAVSLILFAGSGAVLIAERLQGEPMTEFALYNSDGKPEFYPRNFSPDQPQTLQLEIDNHEGKSVTYRIDVMADTVKVGSVSAVTVPSGGTWKEPIKVYLPATVTQPDPGQPIPLLFNLYRTDKTNETDPYRSLRLFINVGTPTPSP